MEKQESKIVRTQVYTVKVNTFDDGQYNMERCNDGFNTLELLGVLGHAHTEISRMISGEFKPTLTIREVITHPKTD
jgi:hypothetical protein